MIDHVERQLARLRDQLAILASARPTPEQLAGEETADKDMARRIHQARPGIPVHHIVATLEAFRAVLEMEPAEPMPVSPQSAEQLREAIESEVYEYRERTMFWPEGAVTTEIARLATRGAMKALTEHRNSAPTPAATEATVPREHCGELSPDTGLTVIRTECVLRPGHTGSHADDVGCRWSLLRPDAPPGHS